MLLTPSEMIALENRAFAEGVLAEDLMETAALGLADLVTQFHPRPGRCHVVHGKGNNAGDVLAAARHLSLRGWEICKVPAFPEDQLGNLPAKKLAELRQTPKNSAPHGSPTIVLDGLLGLGAGGNPRSPVAEAIHHIHSLRNQGAWVLAADVPSGLNAETGKPGNPCVQADVTGTIGWPKTGLVGDDATNFVGRLAVIPLPGLDPGPLQTPTLTLSIWLGPLFPPRPFDTHKGRAGRVGIVAGSPGFTGAAHLCSLGALHGGAGLIGLYASPEISTVLASRCPPEVMVRPTENLTDLLHENLDALAIGPGLGTRERDRILTLIRDFPKPAVVDADALNAVAANGSLALLKNAAAPRILTPHPGEMERLMPQNGRTRLEWATTLAEETGCTILLKGSRTVIAAPECQPAFNTTGNPGMATGGMGDVLSGVLAALLAQYPDVLPSSVAALGAWLCGRSSERCLLTPSVSPESLSAAMTADNLGGAFRDLRNGFF